jgi:hypothetical protein
MYILSHKKVVLICNCISVLVEGFRIASKMPSARCPHVQPSSVREQYSLSGGGSVIQATGNDDYGNSGFNILRLGLN